MFIPVLIIIPTHIPSIYIGTYNFIVSETDIFPSRLFPMFKNFFDLLLERFSLKFLESISLNLPIYFEKFPRVSLQEVPFTFSFFESYCTLNIKELHMQITVVGRQQGLGREALGKCEGELSNKLCMPLNLHFSVEFFLFLFFYINLLLY